MGISLKEWTMVHVEKKKIGIKSVSKNDKREIWTFNKDQVFMPFILQFLLDLGFKLDKDACITYFFGISRGQDDEIDLPEEYVKDPFAQKYLPISLFDQEMLTFENKDKDIEVMFFSNRIVLAIRSKKKAEDIGELIGKFSYFK